MDAFDRLQVRREQATSPDERTAIDRVVDSIGRNDTIVTPGGLMRDLSRPRGSLQTWRETLYVTIADGTAVTAAANTILVPAFTLPPNYMYPGRCLKYTLFGRMSTVITTPGTWTWILKWGGTGGVSMASSGAIGPDPTAASTNIAWRCEWYTICRSIGTSGTAMTWGELWQNDIDDGAAAVANLTTALNNQQAVFPDAAAVATIDTTIAKTIDPTITPSVATGSITCHAAILEALT